MQTPGHGAAGDLPSHTAAGGGAWITAAPDDVDSGAVAVSLGLRLRVPKCLALWLVMFLSPPSVFACVSLRC